MRVKIFFILTMLFVFSSVANAAIINTFQGAAGKVDFLNLPFTPMVDSATGAIPDNGGIAVGQPFTVGAVSFTSASNMFAQERTLLNPGFEISVSGNSNIDVSLSAPVLAFGFDIVESTDDAICGAACAESTFNIELFSGGMGGMSIALINGFTPGNDILEFFGVHTDMLFDFVEIREVVGGAENEYFGEFYTAVPIPAPLILFGSALIALFPFRKRAASVVA